MEYLLVVYILMNGAWVRGDELDGWGSIPYPTRIVCLERQARAEELQADLQRISPRVFAKRYACEAREIDPGASG